MAGPDFQVTATTNHENSPDQQYLVGYFRIKEHCHQGTDIDRRTFNSTFRHRKSKYTRIERNAVANALDPRLRGDDGQVQVIVYKKNPWIPARLEVAQTPIRHPCASRQEIEFFTAFGIAPRKIKVYVPVFSRKKDKKNPPGFTGGLSKNLFFL